MSIKIKHIFPISLLLILAAMTNVYAQESSPAGGGMLLLDGEQAYAMVPPHNVLLKDYHEGISIDGWLYLEEYPEKGETWMLLHKPGAYQIALQHSSPGHVSFRFAAAWKTQKGRHGSWMGIQFQVPLQQWLYFYGIIGKQKLNEFTIFDGAPDEPLIIGRKFAESDLFELFEDPLIPMKLEYHAFHGAIDELRISNVARGGVGDMQVYLGTGADAPQNVPIPKRRFHPDEHTVALWHFNDRRTVFSDASQNALTMSAKKGAFNPIVFSVLTKGKVVTTWGRFKTQKKYSH